MIETGLKKWTQLGCHDSRHLHVAKLMRMPRLATRRLMRWPDAYCHGLSLQYAMFMQLHSGLYAMTWQHAEAQWAGERLTAVAMDSSCMLLRSASSLPSSAQQILEPMRILLPASMPYSFGITQSASCFATYRGSCDVTLLQICACEVSYLESYSVSRETFSSQGGRG